MGHILQSAPACGLAVSQHMPDVTQCPDADSQDVDRDRKNGPSRQAKGVPPPPAFRMPGPLPFWPPRI
eukprot:2268846-Alexandrium_andersonii.AAC.1